jgi:hypothetical protein
LSVGSDAFVRRVRARDDTTTPEWEEVTMTTEAGTLRGLDDLDLIGREPEPARAAVGHRPGRPLTRAGQ